MGVVTEPPRTLLRQLGVISAIALVVSNMVGTGVFTTTGFLAGDLGSAKLILLIWIVGGLCAMAGAFCYSELGINYPKSGGEYYYLTQALGPTWGFMSGWVSFFAGFSAPIAAAALALSDYLGYFIPALKQDHPTVTLGSGDWAIHLGGAQFVASALVVIFTIVNCLGVKKSASLQNALTALKLLVIVAFIFMGIFIGRGDWAHLSMNANRWTTTPIPAQFAASLFWIYVAYSGWNAATYIAEELKNPTRTLPLALTLGTALVVVLYLGLNLVFIYGAPLEQMKGVVAVGSLAASNLFGPRVAGAFSLLMALSLMATINAMVTVGPRVYYAMAKNGAFFSAAAKLHPEWHTPVNAILWQGICTVLMTVTPFPKLVIYIGFTLNFTAVMAVVSLMILRHRHPEWRKLSVVSFAYPLIPVLFLMVGVWITYYGIQLQPVVSAAAAATIAAGALVYRIRVQTRPASLAHFRGSV
jgi:basic amino acid/polyamine antiporter, APA family